MNISEVDLSVDGAHELLRRLAQEFCAVNSDMEYKDMRSAFYDHVTNNAELVGLYGGQAWLARKYAKSEIWRAYDFLKYGGKSHNPPYFAGRVAPADAPAPVAVPSASSPGNLVTVAERVTPDLMVRPLTPPMVHQRPELPARVVNEATVNVTLKSRVDQHRQLRLMSVCTGRSVQNLVSTAVDEYLARQ